MLHGELPNLPKQHVQKLLNTQNKFLESPLLIFIKEKRDDVNATNIVKLKIFVEFQQIQSSIPRTIIQTFQRCFTIVVTYFEIRTLFHQSP
jgi:hypothetical protein